MPAVSLEAVDTAELAEPLRFPGDWLTAGQEQLGTSLRRFAGHPALRRPLETAN